jgi:hypothetical protein
MVGESRADVYHGALRCLLGLFDVAAASLTARSSTQRPSVGAWRFVGSPAKT